MRNKSPDWIARRYRERYADGIGEGKAYIPWLDDVGDVPSRGVCSQFTGRRTGRMHVALSGLERSAILVAQWLDDVIDIREQFPLWPLEETLALAESLGVAHPAHRGSPVLMTTDIVLTKAADVPWEPLTVKPNSELKDKRVLEKFEIERLYWQKRGCTLGIVTGEELPPGLVANLEWIDEYHEIEAETLSPGAIGRIEAELFAHLHANAAAPLNGLCAQMDDRIGEPPGTCLGVVRHCLSRKRWRVPLAARIDPSRPLPLPQRAVTQTRPDFSP